MQSRCETKRMIVKRSGLYSNIALTFLVIAVFLIIFGLIFATRIGVKSHYKDILQIPGIIMVAVALVLIIPIKIFNRKYILEMIKLENLESEMMAKGEMQLD